MDESVLANARDTTSVNQDRLSLLKQELAGSPYVECKIEHLSNLCLQAVEQGRDFVDYEIGSDDQARVVAELIYERMKAGGYRVKYGLSEVRSIPKVRAKWVVYVEDLDFKELEPSVLYPTKDGMAGRRDGGMAGRNRN